MDNEMTLDKNSDEFGTPDWLFAQLDLEFNFTIDACASRENTKCRRFYTKEQDALTKKFSDERVFCNPPYSRGNVVAFVSHAYVLTHSNNSILWVLLIPAKTEQDWFHDIAKPYAEIRFIRKRMQFIGGESGARDRHMLVIFRNPKYLAWW